MREAFAAKWRERFGYVATGELILETLRVEAVLPGEPVAALMTLPAESAPPVATVETFAQGKPWPTPVYDRAAAGGGVCARTARC